MQWEIKSQMLLADKLYASAWGDMGRDGASESNCFDERSPNTNIITVTHIKLYIYCACISMNIQWWQILIIIYIYSMHSHSS